MLKFSKTVFLKIITLKCLPCIMVEAIEKTYIAYMKMSF